MPKSQTSHSRIRRATPEDAPLITLITNAAYSKYIPLMQREPQPMTADYGDMIREHDVFVLEEEKLIRGVLVLIDEVEQLLIYSIAILPEFQKKGFGRVLMAWAETFALDNRKKRIRLYTNQVMEKNIALYCRLGYVETGREEYLGSTIVHMVKIL